MKKLENFNSSVLFEEGELPYSSLTASSSLKSSLVGQHRTGISFTKENRVLGIVKANLCVEFPSPATTDQSVQSHSDHSSLKQSYTDLKAKHISSQSLKSSLQSEIRQIVGTKARDVIYLRLAFQIQRSLWKKRYNYAESS